MTYTDHTQSPTNLWGLDFKNLNSGTIKWILREMDGEGSGPKLRSVRVTGHPDSRGSVRDPWTEQKQNEEDPFRPRVMYESRLTLCFTTHRRVACHEGRGDTEELSQTLPRGTGVRSRPAPPDRTMGWLGPPPWSTSGTEVVSFFIVKSETFFDRWVCWSYRWLLRDFLSLWTKS